jgi:hypothetical protein
VVPVKIFIMWARSLLTVLSDVTYQLGVIIQQYSLHFEAGFSGGTLDGCVGVAVGVDGSDVLLFARALLFGAAIVSHSMIFQKYIIRFVGFCYTM